MRSLLFTLMLTFFVHFTYGQSGCTSGDCENGWGIYEWTSGASSGDKYIGEFKDGKREGEGVYFWHTGEKYIGTWAGGVINGYGTQFYSNGSKTSGYWTNATLTSTKYTTAACISGDCDNGYGIWVYDSGDKYAGYFKQGVRDGEGTYLYSDGDKYVGRFENNKRNGYGVYNWNTGSKYEGYWKDGSQDGYGYYTSVEGKRDYGYYENGKYIGTSSTSSNYSSSSSSTSSTTSTCTAGDCDNGWGIYEWRSGSSSGDKYVGEWKGSYRNGEGVYVWQNGDKYIGTWANGVINGYGTLFFASGSRSVGYWVDAKLSGTNYTIPACISGDCQNGYGVWVYENGDKYAGYFKDGYRNGDGTYLYSDGEKYVGHFEYNKRTGYGTYNWITGTIYEGNWKDGNQDGYGYYTGTDKKREYGYYENGKYIGTSSTSNNYSSNTSSSTTSSTSGCTSGDCENGWGIYEWRTGSSSGDKYIGEWKGGYRNGEGVYFWNSGDKYVGTWANNTINGYGTQFFANGTRNTGYWQDAKLVGTNYTESTCVSGDCNNGYGVWIYDTGDKYTGYFKDGLRSGDGNYIYPDGERYVGKYENHKRNGYGTYYWTDGETYVGTWKDGNQDGYGTLTKTDGTKQIGKFEKGSYVGDSNSGNLVSNSTAVSTCLSGNCENGFGIYTWGAGNWEGDKYIGEWKDGYMSGQGFYQWHSGSKYIGSWESGKQNGYGSAYYSDGTKELGFFKDGKLSGSSSDIGCVSGNCTNGYGVWIYDGGDKYEGYFKDGLRSGQGNYIFSDGMRYVGGFDSNKRSGYGTFYWADGSYHAGSWKDGDQDGDGVYTKADGTVTKGYWEKGTYKGEVNQNGNKVYIANNTNNDNFTNTKSSLSDRIKAYVEEKVNEWQQKGEFEKTLDYKNRVNETTRAKKIDDFQKEAIASLKKEYKGSIDFKKVKLGQYDADNETFLLSSDDLGEFVVSVPFAEAPKFKESFSTYQFNNPDFYIKDNNFVLAYTEIVNPVTKKKYVYDSKNSSTYATTNINYKFNDIVIDVEDKAGGLGSNIKKGTNTINVGKSDVDTDIPVNTAVKSNTYALIIGNEDYTTFQPGLSSEVNVDYAMNDAKIFKEYCAKTMGIPEKQIKLLVNATSAQMNQGIAWLTNLIKVEEGNAEVIFYYSGHGLPDEQTKEGYLIPVDVSGSNANQGVKLNDLYAKLSEFPSKKVSVFLDACFSGGARNQGLIAMKGVKVRPKENVVNGNMVVFTSSTGEESSGVYRDKQHGYMTYFLLKNIQDNKGNISYKDLANYIISNVKKETALGGKVQTPQVNYSTAVEGTWESWKLK